MRFGLRLVFVVTILGTLLVPCSIAHRNWQKRQSLKDAEKFDKGGCSGPAFRDGQDRQQPKWTRFLNSE